MRRGRAGGAEAFFATLWPITKLDANAGPYGGGETRGNGSRRLYADQACESSHFGSASNCLFVHRREVMGTVATSTGRGVLGLTQMTLCRSSGCGQDAAKYCG